MSAELGDWLKDAAKDAAKDANPFRDESDEQLQEQLRQLRSESSPAALVPYSGPCEELQGRMVEIEAHDCEEHMRLRWARDVETHGLDCGPYEVTEGEWWECGVCGRRESEEIA